VVEVRLGGRRWSALALDPSRDHSDPCRRRLLLIARDSERRSVNHSLNGTRWILIAEEEKSAPEVRAQSMYVASSPAGALPRAATKHSDGSAIVD
jgi:hypothetical protein